VSKIWPKIIAVVVIVLFVIGFKSMIITDPTVADAFEGLMETLPFAEPFSKIICNVLDYKNSQPLISATGFIQDIAKLMFMAFIQPILTIIISLFFLRLPSGAKSVYEKEAYMNSLGYRIKEMFVKICTAPISSVLSGWLMALIIGWSAEKFGNAGSVLTSVLTTILAAGASIIPMVILGTTISVALLWRFLVTLLGGMLTALTTTFFSIAIYYALINDIPSHIVGLIFGFVFALIILDIVIQCFQRALGVYSAKR